MLSSVEFILRVKENAQNESIDCVKSRSEFCSQKNESTEDVHYKGE